LKYTSASNAGFITGLSVVMVPVIQSIYGLRMPSLFTILGILTATAGLFLLSVSSSFHISYGDFLVLCCAFGFAMHVIMVGRYSPSFDAGFLTMIQVFFVGAATLVVGLITEPWPPVINAPVLEALVITSIPATALAFLVQNAVQKHTSATRTALIFITEPVFAAAFAHFWAGEELAIRSLVGCVLIIAGMVISELTFSVGKPKASP
jgi:drug/metabolite transporter (DMT)-like permease